MWFIRRMMRRRSKVLQYRDAKGVILLDILPQGQCINAARYGSTLDRLKEAIRRKRPGLLRRGVVLQHDNATTHSVNLTQQWLQRYGTLVLIHLLNSSRAVLTDSGSTRSEAERGILTTGQPYTLPRLSPWRSHSSAAVAATETAWEEAVTSRPVNIMSAYTLTLCSSAEAKDELYEELETVMRKRPPAAAQLPVRKRDGITSVTPHTSPLSAHLERENRKTPTGSKPEFLNSSQSSHPKEPLCSTTNKTPVQSRSLPLGKPEVMLNGLLDNTAVEITSLLPVMQELDDPPTIEELSKAIDLLASGKASGNDGIPPEIINAGKQSGLLEHLHAPLLQC
ncbi:histone-lysine N-methyltransferase SETMAR [Plakobranchus ocellatus]|uniref:Histone-lysine N-methyltransferase SETMAR n=1 Tax=Plakobranchus ocellatus TaxID=259542 RepID=A0AAV4BEI6_9GAST|nr:histone-lysine N-methyltransferase SETMAR [Plakobranchus ocellatus]